MASFRGAHGGARCEPEDAAARTAGPAESPSAVARIDSEGFEQINSQEVKSRDVLMKQLQFFWKLIPDLEWKMQDVVVGGDKVVVRSVATGSPRGSFMGLELDGSRSFRIDTIDIHQIENGKIARVHHLEDWATAIRQLSGK